MQMTRYLVSHLLYIVWDAVEVVEFTRKHTRNVHESLGEIRRIIEALVNKRDERRDGFAKVIEAAMKAKLLTFRTPHRMFALTR